MPAALRTLAPFLRATRQSLKAGSSANPLQSSFRSQNVSAALNIYRSYAVYERSKPHVNIGTIGHVDHGKVRARSCWHSSLYPRRWLCVILQIWTCRR
jgi:elongation factor Tu